MPFFVMRSHKTLHFELPYLNKKRTDHSFLIFARSGNSLTHQSLLSSCESLKILLQIKNTSYMANNYYLRPIIPTIDVINEDLNTITKTIWSPSQPHLSLTLPSNILNNPDLLADFPMEHKQLFLADVFENSSLSESQFREVLQCIIELNTLPQNTDTGLSPHHCPFIVSI